MSKTKDLFDAIYAYNIENVKLALSEGADINGTCVEYGNYTPLMAAAGAWDVEILDFLIDQGANVKTQTPDGDTILSIMIEQAFFNYTKINGQYHNIISKIIAGGVNLDSYNQNSDKNPLTTAMSSADVKTADMLIEAGADLNIIVNKNHPDVPLNRAISQLVRMRPEAEYIIDKMIEKGAEVNPRAENLRSSPLSSALEIGRDDIFDKLISYGANINHDCSTATPLITEILRQNLPMVETLLDNGAHVNPENSKLFYSPLSAAINVGNDQLVQELIAEGANITPDNVQITPIMAALQANRVDILEFMFGLDNIPQEQIINALFDNLHSCDLPAFALALSKVKNINLPDRNGQTLLGRSLLLNQDKTITLANKLIIDHKAKLQADEFYVLAYKPKELVNLVLNTVDNQLVKSKGMNIILENMLSSVNGLNLELLEIFVDHGLTVSPNNVKLALEHQSLPHPIYPVYIPQMLEIVFCNIDLGNVNKPVDGQNNSVCMLLAQNDIYHIYLTKLLNTKTSDGLHVVKVNMTNKEGKKIIDIIADKLALNNGMNYMDMIKLLRHVGSAEPKNPIVPEKAELDIANVHNQKNEEPIRKMQAKLVDKFTLTEDIMSQIFDSIKEYIKNNADHIKDFLNEGEQNNASDPFNEMLDHFYSIKFNDDRHNEHNNSWNLREEVAHVFLEMKEQDLSLDGLIHVLSLKYSCNWGKVVNLYKLVEVNDGESISIDIGTIYNAFDYFADKLTKKLDKLGFSKNMQKDLINKFFDNIGQCRDDVSSYSSETQLVFGLVSDIFVEFITTKMGIAESDIYSLDFANVISLMEQIQVGFEFAEKGDNNLYDLLFSTDDQYDNDMSHEVSMIGGNEDGEIT